MPETKTECVQAWVEPAVRDWLRREAKLNERSMAAQIAWLIRQRATELGMTTGQRPPD